MKLILKWVSTAMPRCSVTRRNTPLWEIGPLSQERAAGMRLNGEPSSP